MADRAARVQARRAAGRNGAPPAVGLPMILAARGAAVFSVARVKQGAGEAAAMVVRGIAQQDVTDLNGPLQAAVTIEQEAGGADRHEIITLRGQIALEPLQSQESTLTLSALK